MADTASRCKRLDHKRIQFYRPWFKAYDCVGPVCGDFGPAERSLFLYRHWDRRFNVPPSENTIYSFFLNGDRQTVWNVRAHDYYFNDFLDAEGNLKWVSKDYYRKSRKSPFGYVLLTEYPDGTVCRYKTKQIDVSKVPGEENIYGVDL